MADEKKVSKAENKKSTQDLPTNLSESKVNPDDSKTEKYLIEPDAKPVVTTHHITVNGKKLEYTAAAGMLPLRTELGEIEAGIFHTAYTVKSDKPRPITFTFNGGPGSASVWLHLGAVGPMRVAMGDEEGAAPAPPYKLIENPDTWLRFTDLVFIDPVGTGFSRSVKKEDEKKFWGLKGDIESVGQFILNYLTEHGKWLSPIYIAGESYGTTRAAGLSEYLFAHGVGLSGISLVSSILNFQTARFVKGNDLPYPLFFPTYAAAAWFHKKAKPEYLKMPLEAFLKEVEEFVSSEFIPALQLGDKITESNRKALAKKMSVYCGLDAKYVDLSDFRILIHRFCKELLREERRTVGRFDTRYKGIDGVAVSETVEHDPSGSVINPVFSSCINHYLREELGYKPALSYNIFAPGELWKHWDWGNANLGHPDTSEALRAAMSKNQFMKVFVASGYYDLATPYFATEFTLDHMGLDPTLRGNITSHYYKAGHMMYLREPDLNKLGHDVEKFYNNP